MSAITNFVYDRNQKYLFQRAYSATFGPPSLIGPQLPPANGQAGAFQYGTIGPKPAPLRVIFDIDRNMYGSSPNHSKVSIYNLSIASRQTITKGFLVQVQAGYASLLGTIFNGNVFITKTDRKGPDIVTEIECLDGGQAITTAVLDKTYPSGTTLAAILQDAATAMSVGAGVALGIPAFVYGRGFLARGACRDTLDRLLKPRGLEWNIQDGNLNIVPLNSPFTSTAILVSSGITVDKNTGISNFDIKQATGLIGVPSLNVGFMQFTSLLNPRLVPGALIQMQCENIQLNGFYKLRRSHFEGDSHEDKWQINCEAIPVTPGSVAPAAAGFNYPAVAK